MYSIPCAHHTHWLINSLWLFLGKYYFLSFWVFNTGFSITYTLEASCQAKNEWLILSVLDCLGYFTLFFYHTMCSFVEISGQHDFLSFKVTWQIFANHISEKELVSLIYKKTPTTQQEKTNLIKNGQRIIYVLLQRRYTNGE